MNDSHRVNLTFGSFQRLSLSHFIERRWKVAKLFCLISILMPMAQPSWAALPPGWSDADIGSPAQAGNATDTNGGWTVTGGGADSLWGIADQFNYVSTTVNGDGAIIAKVTSLQN